MRGHFDVDAGRYISGEASMEELTSETFELLLATAGGKPSRGELAGHAQISIWRDWMFGEMPENAPAPAARSPPPLPSNSSDIFATTTFDGVSLSDGTVTNARVGLVVPTSLCSAEIARMRAAPYARERLGGGLKFVALPHSEGCGRRCERRRDLRKCARKPSDAPARGPKSCA